METGSQEPNHETQQPEEQATGNGELTTTLSQPRNAVIVGIISLILIVLAAFAIWYASRQGLIGSTGQVNPPPSLDELVAEYPQLASILQDEKLASVYKEFFVVYEEQGPEAAYDMAKRRNLLNDRDELRLTLELDTSDSALLQQQLEESGIRVTAVSGHLIDIVIPLDVLMPLLTSGDATSFLQGITELEHVVRVRQPFIPAQRKVEFVDAYQVATESLSVIAADRWQAAGITGAGVKVGVLDLEFDRYRELLGTDLPENVVVRSFIDGLEADQTGGVHGTAVAEIIHDIAPQAELYFAAFQTDAEERLAVEWLVSQGVQIISNSTGTQYGPKDGSSPGAQLVDQVVEGGVLFVNAAGNAAEGHYRSQFTDANGDGFHDQEVPFYAEGDAWVMLNWDAWREGDQDYDLLIYDENDNLVVSGRDTQSGPGSDAGEFISFSFDPGWYLAVIQNVSTTRAGVLDFFVDGSGFVDETFVVKEYSLGIPSDAFRSLTVGAVRWDTDELEVYSSQGPSDDGRLKPEISAPTVVSSAAYGETWDGTSAATPHVSGAAALILQAYPNLSVQELTNYLLNNAVDLGSPGPDNQFGYGRLFLGDPPPIGAAVEEPPPTEAVSPPTEEQPQPTEEQVAEVTQEAPESESTSPPVAVSLATATAQPTATLKPVTGAASTSNLSLILLAGVAVIFLLGLLGISLLAFVWIRRRSARRTRRDEDAYSPAPGSQTQCPNCGTLNRAGASFCNNCGTSLGAAFTPGGTVVMSQPPVEDYAGQSLSQPIRRRGPRLGFVFAGLGILAVIAVGAVFLVLFGDSLASSPTATHTLVAVVEQNTATHTSPPAELAPTEAPPTSGAPPTQPELPPTEAVPPTEIPEVSSEWGNPIASQPGEIFFSTDFENTDNWWSFVLPEQYEDQVRFEAFEGLEVEMSREDLSFYAFYDLDLENPDVTIETYVEKVAGPNSNNIGLVCRYTEQGYYALAITSRGEWYIWLWSEASDWVELGSGTDRAINLAERGNELAAVCQGDRLTLYVNGVEVGSASDSTFTNGGQVGLMLWGEFPGLFVYFDFLTALVP